MRALLWVLTLSVLFLTTQVSAGTVNFADGHGSWQPTRCTAPQPPSPTKPDSEAAANDLNARMALHNAYVAAAQGYMACVSQEAQNDADGVSQAIIRAAQGSIQKTQAQIAASAAQVNSQ